MAASATSSNHYIPRRLPQTVEGHLQFLRHSSPARKDIFLGINPEGFDPSKYMSRKSNAESSGGGPGRPQPLVLANTTGGSRSPSDSMQQTTPFRVAKTFQHRDQYVPSNNELSDLFSKTQARNQGQSLGYSETGRTVVSPSGPTARRPDGADKDALPTKYDTKNSSLPAFIVNRPNTHRDIFLGSNTPEVRPELYKVVEIDPSATYRPPR